MTSDRYAVIYCAKVYLIKPNPGDEVTVVLDNAPTIESAVKALLQAAPPNTVKGVYIVAYLNFEACRYTVETLQKAGYTNIESIDHFSFMMSAFIYKLPLSCAIGEAIFVPFLSTVIVLQKCTDGWKIVAMPSLTTFLHTSYPSVRHVVYHKDAAESVEGSITEHFPDQKIHSAVYHPDFATTFVRNRINKGNLNGYEVLPHCCFDLIVRFDGNWIPVLLTDQVPPFTVTKEMEVGFVPIVEVYTDENRHPKYVLNKTFKFESRAFRTVLITVNVDKTHLPQITLQTLAPRVFKKTASTSIATLSENISKFKLNPPPKTVLTFTSDNRVLVKADESYTGDKEIPAYVRLDVEKLPEVGQGAFDALKTHPESVFYDITRLLATDFDPDHPDPTWGFKFTRDADGKVVIHGGNVSTFPIILFGIVVQSTLLYIREHMKSEISSIGIRLPAGSAINNDDMTAISTRIGVEMVLLTE